MWRTGSWRNRGRLESRSLVAALVPPAVGLSPRKYRVETRQGRDDGEVFGYPQKSRKNDDSDTKARGSEDAMLLGYAVVKFRGRFILPERSARVRRVISVQLPRSNLVYVSRQECLPHIITLSQYNGASPGFLALAVAFLLPQTLARRHRPVLVGHDGTGNQEQRGVREQRPKPTGTTSKNRNNQIERVTDTDSSLVPDGKQNARSARYGEYVSGTTGYDLKRLLGR